MSIHGTLRTWRDLIADLKSIFSLLRIIRFSYFVVNGNGFTKVGQKGVKVGRWDKGSKSGTVPPK